MVYIERPVIQLHYPRTIDSIYSLRIHFRNHLVPLALTTAPTSVFIMMMLMLPWKCIKRRGGGQSIAARTCGGHCDSATHRAINHHHMIPRWQPANKNDQCVCECVCLGSGRSCQSERRECPNCISTFRE